MSHVEQFDAVGVVVFLANLAKEIRKHPGFQFQVKYPASRATEKRLRELGVEDLLWRLGLETAMREDLWSPAESTGPRTDPLFLTSADFQQAVLFLPKSSVSERREHLPFVRERLKAFYKKSKAHSQSKDVNVQQIHHILDEIVKNALDHSNDVALLGIAVENEVNGRRYKFAHCELGSGISRNVRNYLQSNESPELQRLASRGSTSDFLHWAFVPRNTTSPDSKENAGLGLAMIQSASKGGDVELYFSDAESLAYVTDFPDQYTHRMLRRRLYHTHSIPCFMYMGQTR